MGTDTNIDINLIPKGAGQLRYNGLEVVTTAHRVAVKTANEIVTDTTLQNDDHLFFAVAANERWAFELFFRATGTGVGDTAGLKIDFALPASATGYGQYTKTVAAGVAITDLTADTVVETLGAFDLMVHVHGTVKVAGTAGTVQFRWAANAGTGEDITVFEGGYLVAHKVA